MQPKTKFERFIVKIDKTLPKISKTQKDWILKNGLMHKGVNLKSGKTTCLDCGHSYQSKFVLSYHDKVIDICPNCKVKLNVERTRKRNFEDGTYYTIITTHKNLQVIRQFNVKAYYKVGKKKRVYIDEVSRIYITSEGNYAIVGCYCIQSWSGDRWCGDFELRNKNTINNHNFIGKYVYPRIKVIPTIQRNGYNGSVFGLTYFDIFTLLLKEPIAETLLKSNQIKLFQHCEYGMYKVKKYWSSIKICIRNNYTVTSAADYLDYLANLKHYGKDLHNSKYVCPNDFKREHDKYVERKRKEIIKKQIEERKKQLAIDEKKYKKIRKQFFELSFEEDEIKVEFIKSVKKVQQLGDILKHCIYSSQYYMKSNSLLFYAKVNGKPIETVEFDLSTMKVVQSRGLQNQESKYHNKIVDLVNRNNYKIKKKAELKSA